MILEAEEVPATSATHTSDGAAQLAAARVADHRLRVARLRTRQAVLLALRILVSIATMVSMAGFYVLILFLAPVILDAAPMTCLQVALGIGVCAGLVLLSNLIKCWQTAAHNDLQSEKARHVEELS